MTEPITDPNATVASALGRGKDIEFAGKTWQVRPLNFNDLCDLEDRFGSIDRINLDSIKNQRFLIHLILRRTDSSITEEGAGELLTLDNTQESVRFITEIFRLSGILGQDGGIAGSAKKTPAKTRA